MKYGTDPKKLDRNPEISSGNANASEIRMVDAAITNLEMVRESLMQPKEACPDSDVLDPEDFGLPRATPTQLRMIPAEVTESMTPDLTLPPLDRWSREYPWTKEAIDAGQAPMNINDEKGYFYSPRIHNTNGESVLVDPVSFNSDNQMRIRAYTPSLELAHRVPTHQNPDGTVVPGRLPVITGLINTWGLWSFEFGYIEARVMLPRQCGSWPSFFLMDDDFSQSRPHEIDIFEYPISCDNRSGVSANTLHTAMHITDGFGTQWSVDGFGTFKDGVPDGRQWGKCEPAVGDVVDAQTSLSGLSTGGNQIGPHQNQDKPWYQRPVTVGLLRTPDRLVWYVDGWPAAAICNDSLPQEPMAAVLNFAVGGTFPGGFTSPFNDSVVVDYIRSFKLS